MDRFSNLQKLLEQFVSMDAGPSGCALSVTKDGESLFEGYCGCADAESGRPVGPDTLYRTYSCTKVVTAAAFMLLLEWGLVQLDDPVSEYLPEFKDSLVCHYTGNNMESLRPAQSPMRLKHLVTMTSGLTYDGDLNTTQRAVKAIITDVNRDGMPLREFARRASRVPLRFEPGTGWNYGVSHDVLAAVIEVVSGKKFSEYLTDEFFTPLGMKDTSFFLRPDQEERLAVLYRYENGARVPNREEEFKFRPTYQLESGGAGLLSTLGDFSKFGEMLAMGGTYRGVRILGRKTIDLMRQNQLCPEALKDFRDTHKNGWEFMSGYGYGLGVKTLMNLAEANTAGTPGEFSWAGAAGTLLLADPEERLSICYMHQLLPGNREGYCHPRIRNVVYGLL